MLDRYLLKLDIFLGVVFAAIFIAVVERALEPLWLGGGITATISYHLITKKWRDT